MAPAISVGRLKRVRNLLRKPAANEFYLATVLRDTDGKLVPVLFTEAAVATAQLRAQNNCEDARKPLSWFRQVLEVVVRS